MKRHIALLLLAQLGTRTALAANTPTFTQTESKDYFGTTAKEVKLDANGIDVQSTDDFIITLGTELSSKVAAVLNKDCTKPESEACGKNLKEVLGVGPGNNGLHKRVIGADDVLAALGLTWLVYSSVELLKYLWNDGYSKQYENVVQWKIPKGQKEEVEKWDSDGDIFTYKPHEGDPVDVKLDSPSNDKPEDVPVLKKESNGDIVLTFPGHGKDLETTFNKVLCKKDDKRSLNKRVSMSCLLSNVRSLLAQFQVGAALDGVYYLDPLKEFPTPKNELLVEAITGGENALEEDNYWIGAGELKERRKKYATLSSWMAYGYTAGHIAVEGDKFTFSKSFLDNQDDEEEETTKCADDPTFCSNCGGNAKEDDAETLIGSCKGTKDGALKGCKCFVDQPTIDEDWDIDQFKAAFKWMKSLPAEEGDKRNDKPSTTCKPKALPNAFDGPNCSGCNDAEPFSEKPAYKAAAREFCSGDWKFKAEPGDKDAQKWSATLDIFADYGQKDLGTGLPPICAIGNDEWDSIKRPDSKDKCFAKGSWSANSLFRVAVLPAEDQSGCKDLTAYTLPTGDSCEDIFNAIIDDCIPGKKDDETGGYHLDQNNNGCWEWWIYSKKMVS